MMRQWWIGSKKAGRTKKKIYQVMQRYYNFGSWHITPINDRPYALEVVQTLDKLISKNKFSKHLPFVEVGCGLGEIIGSLRWKYRKIGYDISDEVLKAGSLLYPKVKFCKGTFADIDHGDINCLIMLNFIHMIPYDKLKKEIDTVLKKNRVKLFILDTFSENEGTEYEYSHDGEYLFDGRYKLAKRSKAIPCAHGAKRYIEYWRLCKEKEES